MSPHTVTDNVSSVGATLVVWIITGLLSLLGAICYLELGLMHPKSGGEYAYIKFAFGDRYAYIVSFLYILLVKPIGSAITAITFADYLTAGFLEKMRESGVELNPDTINKIVGFLLIWSISCLNIFSVKKTLYFAKMNLYCKAFLISAIVQDVCKIFVSYLQKTGQIF